ncbi:MAG: DUF3181 family protein [Cyanobacteria bacterium P01_A01_bin.17]
MTSQEIEDLAAEIGENVYIDVAKWHLFLAEAHLHTVLAEQFAPMLQGGTVTAAQVSQVLASISVPVGGGQQELPLQSLVPKTCQSSLVDLLEDFQRRL